MAIGLIFAWKAYTSIKKYTRYLRHTYTLWPVLGVIAGFQGVLYLLREKITYRAFLKLKSQNIKKTQEREIEVREFATDEVFVTMDDQKVKLNQLDAPFVVLIKCSNPAKLEQLAQVLKDLTSYQYIAFVLLKNFNDNKVIESRIGKQAYFVVPSSESKQILSEESIYLFHPESQELLAQIHIPEMFGGLSKTLKLKMNKKLDQAYRRSINFQAK